MPKPITLLAGLGLGAVAMYFLDPERGDRRRHVAYDKSRKAVRRRKRELHDVAENAKNHAVGVVAEAKGRLHDKGVDDIRLAERVRAELGHHIEHPRAVQVFAEDGCVTLCGAVSPDELDTATSTAANVPGVVSVDNQLIAQSER